MSAALAISSAEPASSEADSSSSRARYSRATAATPTSRPDRAGPRRWIDSGGAELIGEKPADLRAVAANPPREPRRLHRRGVLREPPLESGAKLQDGEEQRHEDRDYERHLE